MYYTILYREVAQAQTAMNLAVMNSKAKEENVQLVVQALVNARADVNDAAEAQAPIIISISIIIISIRISISTIISTSTSISTLITIAIINY